MKTMADELGTTEAEAEAIWAKKVPIGRVVDQADVAASPLPGLTAGRRPYRPKHRSRRRDDPNRRVLRPTRLRYLLSEPSGEYAAGYSQGGAAVH